MNWKDKCFNALDDARLFESIGHRSRFKELVDCYCNFPFFTKGLCKCMYLSAWDEEHFCIMLEMMSNLSLGKESNTDEMRDNGDVLAQTHVGGEYYVYQLSNAFLDDAPFHLDNTADIEPEFQYIINRALMAAAIIDDI